jgi:hypothetical protein
MLNRFSKFKVRVQFSKGIAGYSNTQGARGAGGWDGVSIHLLKV